MSDEPTVQQSRKGSGVLTYAGLLLGLCILYVLSTGPVLKLCRSSRNMPDAVETFYTPLIYLYLHVPLAQEFFDRPPNVVDVAGHDPTDDDVAGP